MRFLILAAVVLTALSTQSVEAQAWTRDQGSFYINTNYRYSRAGGFFGPDGNTHPFGTKFTQHSLGVYGEVGLISRWLTLSLAGEAFRHTRLAGQGSTQGLGDFQLGLWSGILTEPFRLAAGVVVGVPTGDPSPDAGEDADEFAQATARALPTGDGETDVSVRLAAGHSFGGGDSYPLEHYTLLELGGWFRSEGFHHGLVYRAELGTRFPWPVIRQFLFILRIVGQESFADVTTASSVGLGDGVSYTAYGFEVYVDLTHGFGLGIGRDSAFRAENIPTGAVYKFSLSFQH